MQQVYYEEGVATIEHILPENPNSEWLEKFSISIQDNYIYRIGNYALLEADKNRACGNKVFSEKKNIYQTSQYTLTKQITADEWTPDTLQKRQLRLADTATSIWRLSQLD